MKRLTVLMVLFVGLLLGCRGGGAFIQGLSQGLNPSLHRRQQQQQRWNQERAYRERADFHRMQQEMRWNNPHMR